MTFDIEAFKAAALHDANADRFTALPTGDYEMLITEADIGNGGERDDGSAWAAYDIKGDVRKLDDPEVTRRGVKLGFVIGLDSSGKVQSGPNKNVLLGQLRTAVGKNKPGQAFAWGDPIGHVVVVNVGHRPDKNDPEKMYEQPKAWRAA